MLERIVKKPLVALALAAATVATPLATALPAGATTVSLTCGTSTAKVSYQVQAPTPPSIQTTLTWLTVKNPCTRWLEIGFDGPTSFLSVAPGAHIQWGSKEATLIQNVSHGVRPDWKGFVSKTVALQCPGGTGQATAFVAYSSTNVKTIC
jgi:hypothetical protein